MQVMKPPIEIYFVLTVPEEHFEQYTIQEKDIGALGAEIVANRREIQLLIDPNNIESSKDKISQLLDIVSVYHSAYTCFVFTYTCLSMNSARRNSFVKDIEDKFDQNGLSVDSVGGREAVKAGDDYASRDHGDMTISIATNGEPRIDFDIIGHNNFDAYLAIEKDEGPGYEIISEVYTKDDITIDDLYAALEQILKIKQSVTQCLESQRGWERK